MDNIAGPPVEGDNFFGRETELARFLDTLQQHDILLLGPRRIGKTSFGRALMKNAAAQGWQVVEVNVASCDSEAGFVSKLAKAFEDAATSRPRQFLDQTRKALSKLLQRIEGIEAAVPGVAKASVRIGAGKAEDWTATASALLQLMAAQQQRWLLYVDELPIFLYTLINNDPQQGVARVRRFLDWFRNDVRALAACAQMRWLISGSVGLDTLVQRHGMADTINTLKLERLEPFSEAVAVDMLQALAGHYAITLDAATARALVSAVQWPQPYYLQRVFNTLRRLLSERGLPPAELIEAAVDALLQPGEDNDFHHWEQRLHQQLDTTDTELALALLGAAAQTAAGARAETTLLPLLQTRLPELSNDAARHKFITLRDILLRDAYWYADESSGTRRYRFCLEPLRRWWLRRNSL
ncbi:AAA family ATPase [Plasticicumulans acidivorans]|uniref:AAA+ ATPase superfamily predicted ATPase n=1 Tax=Plasticicumulans acidivorans TaxID=886464 RepID=A0A317MXB8_9GAMM|nr:ATP-binding protein [Plasticicumulans acidivorans]PWV63168.1 AAA+ ATPase superfamily predicted ATPase [Plasticicumulans acidivorans]